MLDGWKEDWHHYKIESTHILSPWMPIRLDVTYEIWPISFNVQGWLDQYDEASMQVSPHLW